MPVLLSLTFREPHELHFDISETDICRGVLYVYLDKKKCLLTKIDGVTLYVVIPIS